MQRALVQFAPGQFKGRHMASTLTIGDLAPAFDLKQTGGSSCSLNSLAGKKAVLYFYPKDDTSGCTKEAHNFQRDLPKYEALHAVVLGVSLDSVESHKTWCAKDGFSFKLLADPDHKVIDAYGVPVKTFGTMTVAMRDTFLISPAGKIVKMWEVKDIDSHSSDVLAAIEAAKKA